MVPSPRRLPHSISLLELAGFEPSVPLTHRGTNTRSSGVDWTRRDFRRDPGACFAAFDAWQRQLQVVQAVGFGFVQPLQLVADIAQQVFPPRNVSVGFDTQRRGPIHHAKHAAAQLRLRDDHLRRVGRRAIDPADLRHRAYRSQWGDSRERA